MRQKLLIADDEPGIVDMLCTYFAPRYDVLTACSGEEALCKAGQGPDLILLDINMPGMDGLSVCRTVRAHVTCPILFLTARIESADKIEGFRAGADDYIVKPFEMKEVLARIHAVLRRSGVEEETGEKKLSFDKLVINLDSYELLVDGQRVDTRPRSWSCCSTWPPPPTGCSPATSCWTRCGASTTLATAARWTYTSSACGRSWRGSSDQWRLKTVWGVGYKFELGTAG